VITLYHGSNQIIEIPMLIEAQRKLDFGAGFYTTMNREQAEEFARKVADRNESATPFVSVFSVAEIAELSPDLSSRIFDEPNEEWLDFVYANRTGTYEGAEFDVIFGPVANDTIFKTFIAYEAGLYTKEETIAKLKVRKLFNQMVFKTETAIAKLTFIKSYRV
jgi:hypothetical protein